jgi:hypothetical protein
VIDRGTESHGFRAAIDASGTSKRRPESHAARARGLPSVYDIFGHVALGTRVAPTSGMAEISAGFLTIALLVSCGGCAAASDGADPAAGRPPDVAEAGTNVHDPDAGAVAPDAELGLDATTSADAPVIQCDPDTSVPPDLVVFDAAGDYTVANGKAFTIPMNAYGVDIYVIGGGGSSDTFHDTPSTMDNHSPTWATAGATVKRSLDRDKGNLLPGQKWEFSIGAGAPDPQDTGLCNVVASNLGKRGAGSVVFDPAAPGAGQVLLRAAGGARGSYCSEHGYPTAPGPGSCLTGAINECFKDTVDPSESQYDAAAGDELWNAAPNRVKCSGVSTPVAVQPGSDTPGCGPGAATVPGVNYGGLVSARAGGVAFSITPCAKLAPN